MWKTKKIGKFEILHFIDVRDYFSSDPGVEVGQDCRGKRGWWRGAIWEFLLFWGSLNLKIVFLFLVRGFNFFFSI